jgi:UDPglucose--hexose-1-phosphate uridylyltransferase
MSELRKDPIIGRWVILSTERGKRPSDFTSPSTHKRGMGFCPFCQGNEHTTPNEIIGFHSGQSTKPSDWTLRVVPNKFPALNVEGELERRSEGMFGKMNGIGAHEVIIETPDHKQTLATMSRKSAEDVFWAFFSRLSDLKKDKRFKYVHFFKNEGEAAGASLEHSHSQLIALPIVPKRVQEEIDSSRKYYDFMESCIFCDLIDQELFFKSRVIMQNEDFIAISPFAPRVPFETWILPKRHESAFQPIDKDFSKLAEITQSILKKLDSLLGVPPYNLLIHTSPFTEEQNIYYHWHIEIIPKLTKLAGFEWGSGFYINPTLPEDATKFMIEA